MSEQGREERQDDREAASGGHRAPSSPSGVSVPERPSPPRYRKRSRRYVGSEDGLRWVEEARRQLTAASTEDKEAS